MKLEFCKSDVEECKHLEQWLAWLERPQRVISICKIADKRIDAMRACPTRKGKIMQQMESINK